MIKLRKKVGDESLAERRKHQQTHRYMTVSIDEALNLS